MKRLICSTVSIIILLLSYTYSLSDNFQEVINIMGIEKYNTQGYEINEYIYYVYNQIVYGSPEKAIKETTQRWKSTNDGKWMKSGQKGEYRLLGYNNIGKVVNNHDFPMDVVPTTEPTQWTFVQLPDALQSWNDISRYKFVEQREYMKNINLMRNDILYNINVNTIGLDKARLDNCSTWKTKGIIYTNRKDIYGKKWEATFVAPEMGSNVKFINSISSSSKDYYISKYVPSVDITLNYLAGIEFLNSKDDLQYIRPEHVKKIESSIYINGYLLGIVITSKKLNQKGTKSYTIYHQDLIAGDSKAKIDIRSKIYTEFTTDGPLYASNSCVINVYVDQYAPTFVVKREKLDESEYIPPIINIPEDETNIELEQNTSDVEVVKIIKLNNTLVAQELNRTKVSTGFVNAGSLIGIKVNANDNTFLVKMKIEGDNSIKEFDIKTKKFEWDEPKAQNGYTLYNSLQEYIDIYSKTEFILNKTKNNIYILEYLVPYETRQTLHSWNTIRDVTGLSLGIDKTLLFSRIRLPYILKFEIYNQIEEETENGINIYTQVEKMEYKLDIFECWTNLYNRDISKYVLNNSKTEVEYDKWKCI